MNCVSDQSRQNAESESEATASPSSSGSSSPDAINGVHDDSGIAAYKWCVGLGGIGFLETVYLTYLKLTGSDAFCPTGGGSCQTILTSDYSSVFGTSLPYFSLT